MKIDARELREVLRQTPAAQNVLLLGKHGIGKSEIITRFYREERDMDVVAFFLGQMSDPGDLIGLLHKDEATGRSVFLPPFWWPVDGKPIVLFLDELNRAGRRSCNRSTSLLSTRPWRVRSCPKARSWSRPSMRATSTS